MTQAHQHNVRPGALLKPDNGFTCMASGQIKRVYEDEHGLYVFCQGEPTGPCFGNPERHYLDGQLDDRGNYVGLSLA